jgi:hypothetical protein
MLAGRRFPDFLSVVAVLGCILLTSYYYDSLPSVMPMSFNFAGQAQGFGPKWTAWIPSAASVFVFVYQGAKTRFQVKWQNLPVQVTDENRPRIVALAGEMNAWVRMWVTIVLLVVNVMVIRAAITGHALVALAPMLLIAIGVILLTTGIYRRRMRKAA